MILRQWHTDDLGESQRVWRYMNFVQFVNILATESLWLAPLSSMQDKREGNWFILDASKHTEAFLRSYEYAASQTVVSCWIAADDESLPMWDAHARGEAGVAISTDVRNLTRTLSGSSLQGDVFALMRVEYSDCPRNIRLQPPTVFDPVECAKYKANDFSHEREVRIVYSRSALHAAKGSILDYSSVPKAEGTSIRIRSLAALMARGVYVSPRADTWMYDTIKSVMRAYGQDCGRVSKSALTQHFEAPFVEPFAHAIRYDGWDT